MTPLAHRLAKEQILTLKRSRPAFHDRSDIISKLTDDAHFFDLFHVKEMVSEVADKFNEQGLAVLGMDFLPAEKCWLEIGLTPREMKRAADAGEDMRHARLAYFIEQTGAWASVSLVFRGGSIPVGDLSLSEVGRVRFAEDVLDKGANNDAMAVFRMVYACLAIINTPRLIGRKQHMPHRGLEKDLAKAGAIGRYPLRAWTEIILEARPTYVDESGVEHEAHLTGRKCLHFCRAHLRIQNGRLILVSAHWRGDPALGIKRTRYKVAA